MAWLLVFGLCAFGGTACRTSDKLPDYSPHENLLSVVSEFLLVSPDDPYRQPVGKDLTGQSIARSTLIRLANYENLHPDRLRPEVLFCRAKALELYGDYESAVRNYTEVASYETELKNEAEANADFLDGLLLIYKRDRVSDTLESTISLLREQATDMRKLAERTEDPFQAGLAMREAENLEVRRSELIISNRQMLTDGTTVSLETLETLVKNHRDSKRALEHALRLAEFHQDLAEWEVRMFPPSGPDFSSENFKNHYDSAVDLLYRISQADGRSERIIARHRLDALLALGEQVSDELK